MRITPRRNGSSPGYRGTVEERFFAKVEVDEVRGCWIWTAAKSGAGYAQFWVAPEVVYAHVWSHKRWVGPVPDGHEVDHLCRVPACVKPAHLEAVTQSENQKRGLNGITSILCSEGHDKRVHGVPRDDNPGLLRCGICRRKNNAARQRRHSTKKRQGRAMEVAA